MQRLGPLTLLLLLLGAPSLPAAAQKPPTAAESRRQNEERLAAAKRQLAEVDAQLQRGEWAPAAMALRARLDQLLAGSEGFVLGVFPADVLSRLAVAEAGLGKEEEALWHWHIAQGLPGTPLTAEQLRGLGTAGAFLAQRPLRPLSEAPPGVTVRRSGDSGPAFVAPHKAAGEISKPTVASTEPPYPEWLELEVVIDAAGKPTQPVLGRSSSWRLAYRVLEGLRSWRFDPATSGGTPVAAFHEVKVNLPADSPPIDQLVRDSPQVTEILTLLHASQWAKAEKRGDQLWETALNSALQSRPFYGLLLTLRALAEAGKGETDVAICRWQAAQALAPLLFQVDLSGFGAPGALLETYRWGMRPPADSVKPVEPTANDTVERPEIRKRVEPRYPEYRRAERAEGKVVLETIIDERGAIRDPRVVTTGPGPDFDASSLDALCAWRFQPAHFGDKPVKVWYSLTIGFEVRD